MALATKIEWCDVTWNPTTGCTKVSPGCANCYAERMAKRLKAMGNPKYATGFKLATHPDTLDAPLKWKKPKRIFVNSMSDLFHESVPFDFIERVFDTMRRAHWHTFQILTKRADNLLALHDRLKWPDNVWMGVSVESQAFMSRSYRLCGTLAKVRFLSLEPLLGPVSLSARDTCLIDWVIVGGETGPGARYCSPGWIVDIAHQCVEKGVPLFVKHMGANSSVKDFPDDLMIREFPK